MIKCEIWPSLSITTPVTYVGACGVKSNTRVTLRGIEAEKQMCLRFEADCMVFGCAYIQSQSFELQMNYWKVYCKS